MSAATEGHYLRLPPPSPPPPGSCSDFDEDADLSGCADAASRVIQFVLKNGSSPKGVSAECERASRTAEGDLVWTKQADSRYVEEYDGRVDPFNKTILLDDRKI